MRPVERRSNPRDAFSVCRCLYLIAAAHDHPAGSAPAPTVAESV